MGRYQCQKCYREFARSDSLRRHITSGVCQEDNKDMSDSEESVMSSDSQQPSRFGEGKDIFGEYDEKDFKVTEKDYSDESTDDEEDKITKKEKKISKVNPWDRVINIAMETLQDTFNETVEETLEEAQSDMDIKEAEVLAFEELKPTYVSEVISTYKDLVGLSVALKKDPVHQKISSTAKRLREEKDYEEDESLKYALKKRKFLFEKKLDEYDPPSYEEEEEE